MVGGGVAVGSERPQVDTKFDDERFGVSGWGGVEWEGGGGGEYG